jgi:nucleoside-diphosphate-sugar epimerase
MGVYCIQNNAETILVTGAGTVGSEVVKQLLSDK